MNREEWIASELGWIGKELKIEEKLQEIPEEMKPVMKQVFRETGAEIYRSIKKGRRRKALVDTSRGFRKDRF